MDQHVRMGGFTWAQELPDLRRELPESLLQVIPDATFLFTVNWSLDWIMFLKSPLVSYKTIIPFNISSPYYWVDSEETAGRMAVPFFQP